MWNNLMTNDRSFVHAPRQWKTTLQCNVVPHWLDAYTSVPVDRLMRLVTWISKLRRIAVDYWVVLCGISTWRCHIMETFSALLALCAGNIPVTGEFPSQGKWCWALVFSLTCALTNDWVNSQDASDLRRHHTHYDVTVMNQFGEISKGFRRWPNDLGGQIHEMFSKLTQGFSFREIQRADRFKTQFVFNVVTWMTQSFMPWS